MKRNLSDEVTEKIEDLILSMKPGEKLPTEHELAEMFAVGRSTIRECLKTFSAKKVIIRNSEGTFVTDNISESVYDPLNLLVKMEFVNLNELIELREILERESIKLATRRASDKEIEELTKIEWQMNEPGITREKKQKIDMEFHNQIAKMSGNSLIEQLVFAVRKIIANQLEDMDMPVQVEEESEVFHGEIIQAIKSRDENAAQKLMDEYLIVSDYKA